MTTDARDALARLIRTLREPDSIGRYTSDADFASAILAWLAEPAQVKAMAKGHRAEIVRETRDMTFGEIWEGRNRAMRAAIAALKEPRT